MMGCAHKIRYSTMAEAEAGCRKQKRQPNMGHGLRRLSAYGPCMECGGFHTGRHSPRTKPAKPQKPLTPGQQRRAAKRQAKELQRHIQRAARRYDFIPGDVADWLDSMAWAARMTADLFRRG